MNRRTPEGSRPVEGLHAERHTNITATIAATSNAPTTHSAVAENDQSYMSITSEMAYPQG